MARPPVNRGNGVAVAVAQQPAPKEEAVQEEDDEEVDPETAAKLGKLRESVLNLLDDNIHASMLQMILSYEQRIDFNFLLVGVMSLLSGLMLSSSVAEIIELSKALRDTKKSLSDHVLQSIKADKQVVSTYPNIYILNL